METKSSVHYGKQLLDVGQKKIVINYHTLTWTRYSFRFSVGKVIRRGLIRERVHIEKKVLLQALITGKIIKSYHHALNSL